MNWYAQCLKKAGEEKWHLAALTTKENVAFSEASIEYYKKQGYMYKVEIWDARYEHKLETIYN